MFILALQMLIYFILFVFASACSQLPIDRSRKINPGTIHPQINFLNVVDNRATDHPQYKTQTKLARS